MNPLVWIVIINLLGFAVLLWAIRSRSTESETGRLQRELLENLRRDVQHGREKDREHLQERMDTISRVLDSRVQESSKAMQGQFKQYATTLKEVTEGLTKLDETNRQVVHFSEQLQDLQSILKQPKGKGVLAEYWLETMLGHVLQPEQYQMQFKFKNGEIVDAVIFFQDNIIPIDAKFSISKYNDIAQEKNTKRREELEKTFKTDLKNRIDETAKYIRPEESTTDFAFMFLPAEGIYYDLLVNKVGAVEVNRDSLNEYAFSKRVVIVSPATFFAYLQTVLQGLKAFRMEESIKDVQKNVEQLGKHINAYDSFMLKVGNHLGTTVSMYNQAYGEFKKIDKDVLKLTNGKVGGKVVPASLERPLIGTESAID
jgi:DNA recombination protein RmuC